MFFKEIIKGERKKLIKILIVPFGYPKNKWESVLKKYKKRYSFYLPEINSELILAKENYSSFLKQIEKVKIIHFTGGSEILIKRKIKNKAKFRKALNGKVIVGISAGTNVFSKYYYSNDRTRIERGLGILPIKTICHYSEGKRKRLEELISYGSNLPTYAIPEDNYCVCYLD